MLRRSHFAIEPPLPLLVTGISGVAGYNARAILASTLSGAGDRRSAAPTIGDWLGPALKNVMRKIERAWSGCSTSIDSPPCWIVLAIVL